MGQCNVEISGCQLGLVASVSAHSAPRVSEPPRGLELIKSCARFYANGAGVAKTRVQLSQPKAPVLIRPATPPSGATKVSISSLAVLSLLFVALPSLALATIVWWGTTAPVATGGVVGHASALSAQTASQGVRRPHGLQEAIGVRSAQPDIVIHKVRTQPITAGAWEGPGSDTGPSTEISAKN
jgi:hypothetical protein